MAILTEVERQGDAGIAKGIDPSAMGIILDLVQTYQYQYPIASTIREVVSNGVDSVKEKNMAKLILRGEKTEEDFFVRREGGAYADSNFDASYYNLEYLSNVDGVDIDFYENEEQRDILVITDYGVGLGGKRLEGYFSIGWSTKRNLKTALGKFGIGAKAPLSITSSYTMRSTYEGVRHEFLIYSDRITSTVPSINLETGQSNIPTTFKDGSVIYGIACPDCINGVEVEVETKKHQRSQVVDAVKTQLMYFKNTTFRVHRNGSVLNEPIAADVIYEDDDIIVSKNNRYSKPHLVLNNVNYGYLDFQELELEQKSGPVAIKMNPDEIEVSPSRESVIWSDKTRAAVIRKFGKVQNIATQMVSSSLSNEKDYLSWAIKCAQVLNKIADVSGVLSALSGLIDTSEIKPVYPENPDIHWEYNTGKQFAHWRVYALTNKDNRAKREQINWAEIDLSLLPLYVQEAGEYSAGKDGYLVREYEFVYILVKPNVEILASSLTSGESGKTQKIYSDMMDLSPVLSPYEDIQIPPDFGKLFEEEEKAEKQREQMEGLSLAAIRKLQGKITYKTPLVQGCSGLPVTMNQRDSEIKDIPDLAGEIVYGSTEDRPLLEAVSRFLFLTGKTNAGSAWSDEIKVVQIAKDNVPYFQHANLIHVTNWFYRFNKGHLTTHPYLIAWNTIRKIKDLRIEGAGLSSLGFLNGAANISPENACLYEELCTYVVVNLRQGSFQQYRAMAMHNGVADYTPPGLETELVVFLDKLSQFQDTASQLPDNERKALSLELFGSDHITSAYGYDRTEVDKLTYLLEQTSPYRTLLSSITKLSDKKPLSQDLEMEIKGYIAYKQGL